MNNGREGKNVHMQGERRENPPTYESPEFFDSRENSKFAFTSYIWHTRGQKLLFKRVND